MDVAGHGTDPRDGDLVTYPAIPAGKAPTPWSARTEMQRLKNQVAESSRRGAQPAPLGGQYRVTDSATFTTAATEVVNTGSFVLEANTYYEVVFDLYWTASDAGSDWVMDIRATNISGALLAEIVTPGAVTGPGGPYPSRCSYKFKTSAVATYRFSGSVFRGAGTGTCQANALTSIGIYRLPGAWTTV